MHILHTVFTSAMGGIEQAFLHTTQALASCGHQVTALIREDAPYRGEVSACAHAVHYAQPRGFYDLRTAWRIRRLLRGLRPDLIIAHAPRAMTLMHLARRGLRIPLCGVAHGYKTARLSGPDRLVALTPHMRDVFAASGHDASRIHVIPNLLKLPPAPAPHARGAFPVIGTLGRLTPEKAVDDFIRALALLAQAGVAFEARIAGAGREDAALRALARSLRLEQSIHWEGWVSDRAAFFDRLDVYCLPSRQESFGLALLEAMAHGVPAVTTDAPGPADLITHEVSGLIVPRGDVAAMAAALQRLCADPALASGLRAEALARAQDFRFEAVAAQWDALAKLMTAAARSAEAA